MPFWGLTIKNNSYTCYVKRILLDLKACHLFHYFWAFCIGPLCQTLWNTLDKSRKIAWTSKEGLASKTVKMLCVTAISWCIQESPGLKPYWFVLSRQFRSKKIINTVQYQFFKNFRTNWQKWWRMVITNCLFPFLCTGIICLLFLLIVDRLDKCIVISSMVVGLLN